MQMPVPIVALESGGIVLFSAETKSAPASVALALLIGSLLAAADILVYFIFN